MLNDMVTIRFWWTLYNLLKSKRVQKWNRAENFKKLCFCTWKAYLTSGSKDIQLWTVIAFDCKLIFFWCIRKRSATFVTTIHFHMFNHGLCIDSMNVVNLMICLILIGHCFDSLSQNALIIPVFLMLKDK